jgi:peptidoglycan hydrolase CwlO-like protein
MPGCTPPSNLRYWRGFAEPRTLQQTMKHRSLRSTALAAVTGMLLSLLPTGAHADALSDLEAQIQHDQDELAQINTQSVTVGAQIADTQGRITLLEGVLADLNSQLLTNTAHLSDQQHQLDTLVAREDVLTGQLNQTEVRLDERQAAFAGEVRVLDKVEYRNPLGLLLTSNSFGQFLQRLTGIRQVADGTHQMAVQLRADRDVLAAQRAELDRERAQQAKVVASIEAQRAALQQEYDIQASATAQLFGLRNQLGQEQAQLVAQSNSLTGTIQDDEAQLASLLAFSSGQGGNIVAPEYLSDGWGNYYNQRDARWGNVYLGNSGYEVWQIGCLVRSVAMVNSHFGFTSVTPGVIASNPANFTSDGLLYNFELNVPGHPAMINNSPSKAWIDSVLDQGGTVIVGMFISSGGTHFVVLVGRNGANDYWINDPWEQDAMHVSYLGSPVTGPIYDAIGYL